jgi:glycerol transport system ATP-binding protein
MIYVTHDQTEALTFADKVVVMYDGRVVQIGTPQELFERPAHTFVGYFIGSPGMNLFDAEIDGTTARIAGATVHLDGGYAPGNGKIKIGVRPEFVKLTVEKTGVPATIKRVEDVGRHKIIRLDVDGHEVSAIAGEDDAISEGAQHITFDSGGINVYVDDWRIAPEGKAT